jgi:lipid-binding SYLF domain-containing protein
MGHSGLAPTTRIAPTSRRTLLALSAGGIIAGLLPLSARAAMSDAASLLTQAHAVIDDAKHDPEFGNSPALLRSARAVMIVPQLVKGGFFIGGEGGDGVLISRTSGREWGQPAFYALGSASFGLQIGVEVAELVLFIMTERALRGFMRDSFKLGAEAGLTVVTIGSNAQAAATLNGADIIAWAKSKGAYAGLTLEGSIISPLSDMNAAYYGRPATSAQIIDGSVTASSQAATALRESLRTG